MNKWNRLSKVAILSGGAKIHTGTRKDISVPEIREALGSYFSFEFAQKT
jgi:hypothetical protein